jgi:glutathionyl-hydroquinone reductase
MCPSVHNWFYYFTFQKPKCTADTVNGCAFLKQVYLKADPGNLQCMSVAEVYKK